MDSPYLCAKGTYNDLLNQVICKQCVPGYYCPNDGIYSLNQLIPCSKGYLCPLGSYDEIQCLEDTYQNETNSVTCNTCPLGYECLGLGTVDPSLCSPGYVCNFTSDNTYSRSYCPEGYYCVIGVPLISVYIIFI